MAELQIELTNPVGHIMREIADPRFKQRDVALTYAIIMRQMGHGADYAAINAAIMQRWKGRTALNRIKEAAWKILEARNG
ncbi:MAG: hypothetical protein IT170_06530 [Bryobacterales bacterium]|nr:hypothetical protein [Bryobacterales bacterium]